MRLLERPEWHALELPPQRVERPEERLLPRVVREEPPFEPEREAPLERVVLQRQCLQAWLRLLRREQLQELVQERVQALECPLEEPWLEPQRP